MNGADANAPNAEGLSPLAQVIQAPPFTVGDTEAKQSALVRLLLKYGADPNRTLPLYEPGGKLVVPETVASSARAIGMKPSDEITMLSLAAADGEEAVVGALLTKCDVNRRSGGGMTALHWAALAGQSRIVYQLLRSGAAPDVRDDAGQTALDIARRLGMHLAILQLSAPGGN